MAGGMEKMIIPCALLIVILFKMFRTAWWMGLVGLIMCLFFLRKHLVGLWRRFMSPRSSGAGSAEENVQLLSSADASAGEAIPDTSKDGAAAQAEEETGDEPVDSKTEEAAKPPASCVNPEPPSTTPTHEPERQELYTRDPKLKANYTGEHEVRNRLNQENLPLPTGQAMREFAKELCKDQVHHKDAYMVVADAETSAESLGKDPVDEAGEAIEVEVDPEDFVMDD